MVGHHLEFLSLKGSCTDSSEFIHVKMPHCWKSRVAAHLSIRTVFLCFTVVPELLWVAPEILRNHPRRSKSQPGDVYSFSIILFEMCTRNEPFITEPWYHTLEGKSSCADPKKLRQGAQFQNNFIYTK